MIKRELYLNKLIAAKDKDYVKLLIGVRRSGKSSLLMLMQNYLLENNIDQNQIININFEMNKFNDLKNGNKLHQYVEERIIKNKKMYLFLDEVQEVSEWAYVVNSLRASFNVDIYATGSNARMFIGEHLTYLAGRYLTIKVYPLSYIELVNFSKSDFYKSYDIFLDSSFPSIVLEDNEILKRQLKQDVFSTIFERDILLRGKITRENEFFSIARYVLENIGNPISINKIYNTMKSNNINISYDSVTNYLDLMVKSFFLYECRRFDVKGKEELKTLSKYYVVDFGIRNQLIPNINSNRGRILENFVFLELIKAGYEVYSGIINRTLEVDFIIKKDQKIKYIQVSESIIDPIIREREVRPFKFIKDNYNKIIITLDSFNFTSEYATHMNLFEFIKYLNKD